MSENIKREDLRIQKTHKYLRSALESLLERKNFKQITVNDLCEESLVSRAAFYSHFKDKYDLLESWLGGVAQSYNEMDGDAGIRQVLNDVLYVSNKKCKNVIVGADSETIGLVHNFFIKVLEPLFKMSDLEKASGKYVVQSNFCVGGLLHLLSWQMAHSYPQELKDTGSYLQSLLETIIVPGGK